MDTGNTFMDDLWYVRIYKAEEVHYESIDLQNLMFPYWVVSYVLEGEVQVTDAGLRQEATTGQVMLHAPGLFFSEKASVPGVHQWLLIEATNHFQVDLFRMYPITEVITLSDKKTYRDLFRKILDVMAQERSAFRDLALSGLGLQLMYLLLYNWEQMGRPIRNFRSKKNDERLDVVMHYLYACMGEKTTRQTLANLVHLNPNYLDKIFAQKYQMNPMQMLRELRLKKAKHMLIDSEAVLSEIAASCGMGDASYLSHQFMKRFGVNPGQFREQVRQAKFSYYR